MSTEVDTRPVGPADLPDWAQLFNTNRTTRNCWCMAFCVARAEYTAGWTDGGNRVRFEAMTVASPTPTGILAVVDGEPVGWCACGPRSRYIAATSPRSKIMRNRVPAEDDTVWLLPCLFVRVGHRRQGVTSALLGAAIDLARREGATAIEAWPRAGADRGSPDAYLGREKLFDQMGFTCVDRPTPRRAVMRLDLSGRPTPFQLRSHLEPATEIEERR